MNNQILRISTHGIDIDSNVNTWGLPEGAIARFGKGGQHDLAFSPDGKYLAISTWVGVWWYDVSTWSPIALWETEVAAKEITFSPNMERFIIYSSRRKTKVYHFYLKMLLYCSTFC